MTDEELCTDKQGSLPECAPLAAAQIPPQTADKPSYDRSEALARGTLFPGLDLPFMDYVATKPLPRTPTNELMALDFVCHELTLYLDTHRDDAEAFAAWKQFDALAQTARMRYRELYGPVTVGETADCPSWTWVNDPWPWDRDGKGEK